MAIKSLTFITWLSEETKKNWDYRLKMYYYPIKANDRPNSNPIFVMRLRSEYVCG